MAFTSGGIIFRRKGKRWAASRLRPVTEDAASTTELFNGHSRARRNGTDKRAAASETAPDEATAANGAAPLLRYEWRSSTGETLVVEAGWPVAEGAPGIEPEVTLVQEGGPAPSSIPVTRPGLDLRA